MRREEGRGGGKIHMLQNGDYSPPQYVFTASELPPFFPIPQHIEMSFLPAPPRKLFFCCLEAPTSTGGETCLCDFKKVYDQMDPKVRQTFEEKGVSDDVLVILVPSPSPIPNDPLLKVWEQDMSILIVI